MLCIVLSTILCALSLNIFSVNSVCAVESKSAENESIILYEKIFLAIGEEYAFELQFEIDYYYITTVNSSVVSVVIEDSVYKIVGVAPGKTGILVNYRKLDGTFTSNICTVYVFDDYTPDAEKNYIYLNIQNYVLSGNAGTMMHGVQSWSTREEAKTVWDITEVEDNYYSIKLASSDAYLNIALNGQVVLCSSMFSTPTRWRFLVDAAGNLLFVPKNRLHPDQAMGYNTTDRVAYLASYFTNNSTRKWRLYPKAFYIDNHYDESILYRMDGTFHNSIRQRITSANVFVTQVYESLGVCVESSGNSVLQTGLLAESCPRGDLLPCDGNCDMAHKDIMQMAVEVYNELPRKNNHLSVLWADRPSSVYTYGNGSLPDNASAYHLDLNDVDYPSIAFLSISKRIPNEITDRKTLKAIMAVSLAHEVAHALGLYEASQLTDENGNEIHTTAMEVKCMMNYMNPDVMEEFYNDALVKEVSYFCDDCTAYLEDSIPNIIYKGNQ